MRTASESERRAATWVAVLFGLSILLQRFAVPGLPMIALLVPVVLAWTAAALVRGVATVEPTRLAMWLGTAGATGMLMLMQARFVPGAQISLNSWALVLIVWLPFTVRIVAAGAPAYLLVLRYITTISTALGGLSLLMIGSQLAGLPYTDFFAEWVPKSLQLEGFILSYPIEYGSPIFKSNAWIGLEPSIVSALLGIGVLAAILVRAPVWQIVVMIFGMIATVAGSGIIIVLIGLPVLMFHRSRRLLPPYLAIGAIAVAAASFTGFGKLIIERSGEFGSGGSSASLRGLEPYLYLFPTWTEHLSGVLLGYGPGSSQRLANNSSILGLLIPTPAKIYFEYGLVGGFVLAGFLLVCYWGGPSRTFAVALLVSIWMLQSGLATPIIVIPVLVTVTLWSPRVGPPIESIAQLWAKPSRVRTSATASSSSTTRSEIGTAHMSVRASR